MLTKTCFRAKKFLFNTLHPNVIVDILYTVHHTFLQLLTTNSRASLVDDNFLYSCELYDLIQGRY